MATTYAKLRDGSWGIRAEGELAAGQQVKVTKKSGEAKVETVGRIVWHGGGITLATIAGSGSSTRSDGQDRRRYQRTSCSCGSLDGFPRDSDCWTCKHDA